MSKDVYYFCEFWINVPRMKKARSGAEHPPSFEAATRELNHVVELPRSSRRLTVEVPRSQYVCVLQCICRVLHKVSG
jgi:hypothetical protein